SRDLMSHHRWCWKRDLGFHHVQVGVTDTAGIDLDEYFARARLGQWNLLDMHASRGAFEDGGSHCLHALGSGSRLWQILKAHPSLCNPDASQTPGQPRESSRWP